jgi:hypothetical protein
MRAVACINASSPVQGAGAVVKLRHLANETEALLTPVDLLALSERGGQERFAVGRAGGRVAAQSAPGPRTLHAAAALSAEDEGH